MERTQVPYIKNKNSSSTIEHEATTSKINEEQLFYCNQRGLNQEEAVSLIVNGFVKMFYNNYQWNLLLKHKN